MSALGVRGVDFVSENAPIKLRASELGANKGTKFVDAACGRNHTLLVGSDGQVWAAGANALGQVRALFTHAVRYLTLYSSVLSRQAQRYPPLNWCMGYPTVGARSML